MINITLVLFVLFLNIVYIIKTSKVEIFLPLWFLQSLYHLVPFPNNRL